MDIEIVTDDAERRLVDKVLDGHSDMKNGDMPRAEWDDADKYPRKTWLFVDEDYGEKTPFVVVDNRSGECFVETFESLDGAILYACDVYVSCAHQDSWDYPGAVKDRGNLTGDDPCPCL